MNNPINNTLTGFWSGWVIILTGISLLGLAWFVFSIYFSSSDDDHNPVWDDNLSEGTKAPPLWWFWLIFTLLIFSVVYLILYPGMGNFPGTLHTNHHARLHSSVNDYESRYEQKRHQIEDASVDDLRQSDELMLVAQRLFKRNCAACHGEDARGQAHLFPSLRDNDWQWGKTNEQIEVSIRQGRIAQMPGWKGILTEDDIDSLTDYVIGFRRNELKGLRDSHQGHEAYLNNCVVCHGAEGEGNSELGAPRLGDYNWVYGNSEQSVKDSIANGRGGVMPAFGGRLDDMQIKLLVAWLSQNEF